MSRGRDTFAGRPLRREEYQRRSCEKPTKDGCNKDEVACVVTVESCGACCRCGVQAEYLHRDEKSRWCMKCAMGERIRHGGRFDFLRVAGEQDEDDRDDA